MKRPLFIIIGIIFVVLLLAIWIYVLFFGGPANPNNTFTDLDFGDTTDPTVSGEPEEIETEPTVDVTGTDRLRQLTTKRVIGYEHIARNASSTPHVYFAEAGVGHIYSINLVTGEERRISATTIPNAHLADFTPNGDYLMIRSGNGTRAEVLIGALSTTSDNLSTRLLDEAIIDFAATTENTFVYAVQTANSVIAKEYLPTTDTSRTLFTIPFREAIIQWGTTADGTHYAYPKATSQLEGFAFQITDGNIRRIAADGYGFSITGSDTHAIFSAQDNNTYTTYTYTDTDTTSERTEAAITVIPEKCVSLLNTSSTTVCAHAFTDYDHSIPDSWYKGTITFADNLWDVDLESGSATFLINTTEESGRELDIINLEMHPSDEVVYFQNKHDFTLWLFERVVQE